MKKKILSNLIKKSIFLSLGLTTFSKTANTNEITPQYFTEWWAGFRETPNIPSELKMMEDYFVSSELINNCSKFWLLYNKKTSSKFLKMDI